MHTEASKPALQREDAPASGWPLGLERADWQQAVGDVLFECWFPSRRLRCSAQLCTLLELNALPSDPWAALRERVHPEDRPGLRRGDHTRVAMAGVDHGDAGDEVDEATALDVPDLGVERLGGKQGVGLADAARQRGGTAGHEVGVVQARGDGIGVHGCLLSMRLGWRRLTARRPCTDT